MGIRSMHSGRRACGRLALGCAASRRFTFPRRNG